MTDNQSKNKERVVPLLPHQWKKGQSGNPAGRPKGKTMKEYAKDLLACQTEEERQKFLHGLSKDVIWKMAEGNPDTNTDVTTGGQPFVLPSEVITKYNLNAGNEINTSPSTEGDSK